MIEKVLEYNLPTVIDADGINNISEDERLKKKVTQECCNYTTFGRNEQIF